MAQPTWVEMHRVARSPSMGMRTVSTLCPSARRKRYLRVPSALSSVASGLQSEMKARAEQLLPQGLGEVGHGGEVGHSPDVDPAQIWPARKRSLPIPARKAASSSGVRFLRSVLALSVKGSP